MGLLTARPRPGMLGIVAERVSTRCSFLVTLVANRVCLSTSDTRSFLTFEEDEDPVDSVDEVLLVITDEVKESFEEDFLTTSEVLEVILDALEEVLTGAVTGLLLTGLTFSLLAFFTGLA